MLTLFDDITLHVTGLFVMYSTMPVHYHDLVCACSNRPTWPGLQKPMQPLQELILYCLDSDPQHRPYVDDVISRAKTMQQTVVL